MTCYEKISLGSRPCLMHNNLYDIPELESFREQMKEYFATRYSIDYISMNILSKNKDLLFFRMDNDQWHESLKKQKWTLQESNFFMSKINTMQSNEIYFEYFGEDRMTNIRADIFGVRKYGGCDVLISTDDNDMVIYYITFSDDRAFGELLRGVLNALVKDLIRYRTLFTPFLRYKEQGGDFLDKIALHQHLNKFKLENRSLFHII